MKHTTMKVREVSYPSEVRMAQFNSNLKRFGQALGIDEDSFDKWKEMHVTTMGLSRGGHNPGEFDIFCDTRWNETAIYNENGVPVYQNFNGKGEFV